MRCERTTWTRNRKKVDGTLGPPVVSFCSSLCQSPFPLGSITAYTSSCCPARYKHNPSVAEWSQELGAGSMFNISILLILPWGEAVLARSCSKINTRLTAIWSTALKILKWQIPPTAWALSPNKHSSSRLQQSVRQASPTADQRPQTKLGRLDQTNDPVCGKVARLFKQRGDWLCTLLFIAAFIWGRIDFVKARRLSHPREQSLWGSQGCVAPRSMQDGEEPCTGVLLSSFANMPPLDHHFYESCYKSFLLQWKHLLWLPALLLANVIVIIIPGRAGFTVIMSATLMRRGGQHQIIWVKNILRGRMTFTQQLPARVFCMKSSVWKVEYKQEEHWQ